MQLKLTKAVIMLAKLGRIITVLTSQAVGGVNGSASPPVRLDS